MIECVGGCKTFLSLKTSFPNNLQVENDPELVSNKAHLPYHHLFIIKVIFHFSSPLSKLIEQIVIKQDVGEHHIRSVGMTIFCVVFQSKIDTCHPPQIVFSHAVLLGHGFRKSSPAVVFALKQINRSIKLIPQSAP